MLLKTDTSTTNYFSPIRSPEWEVVAFGRQKPGLARNFDGLIKDILVQSSKFCNMADVFRSGGSTGVRTQLNPRITKRSQEVLSFQCKSMWRKAEAGYD
jgi:hypothetical protein